MYTFEDLKQDVAKEAEALRVHATKEELERLDIALLNPANRRGCIYGGMTGHCDSARAIELINKCACRFIVDNCFTDIKYDGFDRISINANGTSVENLSSKRHGSFDAHYSAIEAYILLPQAQNANLIAFLKGETETLDL